MLNYNWKDHLKEYLIAVLICTILYYAYVILRYYRPEAKKLLSGKGSPKTDKAEDEEVLNPFEPAGVADQAPHQQQEQDYMIVGELLERMGNLIQYAADADLSKKDLTGSIKMLLAEYTSIQDPVLRTGVASQIVKDCKRLGTVPLEVRDVDGLWG